MSEVITQTASQEALHPLIEALAEALGEAPEPLPKDRAEALLADFAMVPDEDLGFALESLERLAAFCHQHLQAIDVAAQLVDLCFDTAPILAAAAERLKARQLDRAKARRQQFAMMTGASTKDGARAPAVGLKPSQSVNSLRPKTRFV